MFTSKLTHSTLATNTLTLATLFHRSVSHPNLPDIPESLFGNMSTCNNKIILLTILEWKSRFYKRIAYNGPIKKSGWIFAADKGVESPKAISNGIRVLCWWSVGISWIQQHSIDEFPNRKFNGGIEVSGWQILISTCRRDNSLIWWS